MPDLGCRVAKIEEKLENFHITIDDIKIENRRKMDAIEELMQENKKSLLAIEGQLQSMKGFTAGIIFAGSSIFGLINYILKP